MPCRCCCPVCVRVSACRSATQLWPEAPSQAGFLMAGTGSDDLEKIALWYRLGAALGHAQAQKNFGGVLISGRGVQPNIQAGIALLCLSAKQGYGNAVRVLQELRVAGVAEADEAMRAMVADRGNNFEFMVNNDVIEETMAALNKAGLFTTRPKGLQ